jgi:hypothetical protein
MEGTVLAHRNRRILQRVAVGDGFLGRVLHHAQTDVVIEFVHGHRIVGGLARNAALEDGDGL